MEAAFGRSHSQLYVVCDGRRAELLVSKSSFPRKKAGRGAIPNTKVVFSNTFVGRITIFDSSYGKSCTVVPYLLRDRH
jgi:hypothetical protein